MEGGGKNAAWRKFGRRSVEEKREGKGGGGSQFFSLSSSTTIGAAAAPTTAARRRRRRRPPLECLYSGDSEIRQLYILYGRQKNTPHE